MKILLVNDDGINSVGLRQLAKVLSDNGHIVHVVAPDSQRSGYSHFMTFRKPIYCITKKVDGAASAYSITGTPTDCVKFALVQLDINPDLVISGPNEGANYGTDVIYSGTVSASQEACILGRKTVALSCKSNDKNEYNYDGLIEFALRNLDNFVNYDKPYTFLSVNAPSLNYDQIKGVKLVRLGIHSFNDRYDLIENDDGQGYSLDGEPKPLEVKSDCDITAVHDGYIAITPIKTDRTDYDELDKLKEIFK